MRAFDMTPLLRTTVRFDRLARTMDSLASEQVPTYPPYNIEKLDDDAYAISLSVAGRSEADLDITVQENTLADHIKVGDARLEHGLLHSALKREVREEGKARTVSITTTAKPKQKALEKKAA